MLDVYSYNGKGSKKLNRSGLMKNRYQIVSMDIQKWKLNEFKKEQEKLSSYNIETKIVT